MTCGKIPGNDGNMDGKSEFERHLEEVYRQGGFQTINNPMSGYVQPSGMQLHALPIYTMQIGSGALTILTHRRPPNFFVRFMQKWVLGITWSRLT
jgi:hypothetical protein